MTITPTLSLDYVQSWRPGLAGLTDDDILQFYHAAIPQLRPDAVIVEIGVWRGRSLLFAAELLAALGRPESRIYGIDPYRYPPVDGDLEACTVSYRDALAGLVEHGSDQELGYVHLVRARSAEAAGLFRARSVDLVLIDADHSYDGCSTDICEWWPTVRRGGVIAGHDYAPEHPGVIAAVEGLIDADVQRYQTVWWQEV